MKIRNLFALTAISMMALTACNNDDVVGGEPDNGTEILEGEKTYAVFNIAIGEGGETRTETPSAGEEGAIRNEAKVDKAGLYIFKWATEKTGEPEVMVDDLAATLETSGDWDFPAVPVMLTSGKKHVVVVTNMTDAIKAELRTAFSDKANGYTKFYQVVAKLGDKVASIDNFDISNLFSESDTKDSSAPYIIMSGETDKVLKAGVTQSEAELASSDNHVMVFVNRFPAKIDVKLGYYNSSADQAIYTELPVPATANQVGTVKSFAYDVRNQNRGEYAMKHVTGTFVNTLWSAPGTTVDADRYFPIVDETLTFPGKLLTNDTQASADNYREYVTYIPENTNETALRGNTSYTALKASYIPTADCYVSGYTHDANRKNAVTLTKETYPTTIAEGSYSLFNYNYNIAFKIESTSTAAASDANMRALAGYHVAQVADVLGDIKIDNVQIANAVAGFQTGQKITTDANQKALAAATKTRGAATLWIKIDQTLNASGDLEQYIITGAYYYSPNADGEYTVNEGINFGSLTCGLYTTNTEGLKCYYRVNIYDPALGVTNMMHYSVVRNYSYHMTISKINSIGYPTQVDLTVDPDEPLTNNTFVQAHIKVNMWTRKAMNNVEVGM